MPLFFVGLLLGLLLGWLTLWCYLQPAVGRICARVFAVVALSLGVGLLVWAIVAEAMRQHVRPVLGLDVITQSSDAIAWGSGFLMAGITSLVLSFLGRKRSGVLPPEKESVSS